MLRILTTLYNALPFIGKCLETITEQSVRDWRCYVLNDLSTDGSDKLVAQLAKRDERIVIINHAQKLYIAGAYLHALSRPEIADNDICISVDGDDWLPDEFVFHRIIQAYADPKTWLTWGSMLVFQNGSTQECDYCKPLASWDNLRSQNWVTSHLRTWRAFLFRAINPTDLCDHNGNYWRMGGDLAFMLPMLEMAGPSHAKFLGDYNYVYNFENPLSDHRVDGALQWEMSQAIRRLPPYKRLERPITTFQE
jgi:glycosyltransferase involved in cell wall biosynthesis